MKRSIAFLLLILTICCSKDENKPLDENNIMDDIESVESIPLISTKPYIIFDNDIDLIDQLKIAFPLPNTGKSRIPQNALERVFEINTDSTEADAFIKIKDDFKEKYQINNTVSSTISIRSIKKRLGDIFNSSLVGLTWLNNTSENVAFLNSICESFPTYEFENRSKISFPITFHILEGADLDTTNIDKIISNLNNNFFDAKIEFKKKEILYVPKSGNSSFNFFDVNNGYQLEYDNKSIHINVADYIGIEKSTVITDLEGIAHFPDKNKKTNIIYVRSKYFNTTFDNFSWAVSHELGHMLGLMHTFEDTEGLIALTQCNPTLYENDGISETPVDQKEITSETRCDEILVSNMMSYYALDPEFRNCERSFTNQQNKRMRFVAGEWLNEIAGFSPSLDSYNYTGVVLDKPSNFRNPTFSINGMHLYAISDGKIVHSELNDKYSFENLDSEQTLETYVNGGKKLAKDVVISSNGTILYAKVEYIRLGSDLLLQYNLPVPYSLESAELVSQKEVFYAYRYLEISGDDETLYLQRNPAPNQGIAILGFRFGTPNDVSTIAVDIDYTSPWTAPINDNYVFSKDGSFILRSPLDGDVRFLRRYQLAQPWQLSTLDLNVESEISHSFSSNGAVVEFYDEIEKVIFLSTYDQGIFQLHKYER